MKREIYIYTCMECGASCDSTTKEKFCHVCGSPDITEEIEEDNNESGKSN